MLKVGITGGIGSGKSYVCSLFKKLGIPLIEADLHMKGLYQNNSNLRNELILAFGEDVYLSNKEINIPFLKELLQKEESRNKLNSIAHPYVFQAFDAWAQTQDSPYILKEAAILFESGANKTVDKTVAVIAPRAWRVQKIKERDGRSEQEIQKIMDMQLPDDELAAKVDFIIYNDGTSNTLETQIIQLHHKLVDIAAHFPS
jgi:dephospho-CoA kinase